MSIVKDKSPIKVVSIKLKLTILFVDFAIFGLLISLLEYTIYFQLDLARDFPWLFRFFIYFIFFTLSEFFFNRTLGMKLFKVSITYKNDKKLIKAFVIYSILIMLDRFLFLLIIYFFRVFFHSKNNLLLSEKYSGIRWSKE